MSVPASIGSLTRDEDVPEVACLLPPMENDGRAGGADGGEEPWERPSAAAQEPVDDRGRVRLDVTLAGPGRGRGLSGPRVRRPNRPRRVRTDRGRRRSGNGGHGGWWGRPLDDP